MGDPSQVGRDPVTRRYAERLTPHLEALLAGKPADHPLVRQFRSDVRELAAVTHERADPIGDEAHSPVKGIVHRHADRVLLKLHLFCPAYCRFCFRRDSLGDPAGALSESEFDTAVAYIRAHPKIWEVILTGGDPLALSPRRLGAVLSALQSIEHVAVIRIHTRVPIVDPAAIDAELVRVLSITEGARSVALYVAIHVNHPEELTAESLAALGALQRSGATLVSQTVLLKGVNDDAQTLETLFRALVRHGVKPYYLHHPDLAPGTSHFRISIEQGQALMRTLRARVSGLCLPTYVLDLPGGAGKIPIGPTYEVTRSYEGKRSLLDLDGRTHLYPE